MFFFHFFRKYLDDLLVIRHTDIVRLVFFMLLHLFIAALWSLAGNGLTSLLLLVMFIVFLLISYVVSWVRCGT